MRPPSGPPPRTHIDEVFGRCGETTRPGKAAGTRPGSLSVWHGEQPNPGRLLRCQRADCLVEVFTPLGPCRGQDAGRRVRKLAVPEVRAVGEERAPVRLRPGKSEAAKQGGNHAEPGCS